MIHRLVLFICVAFGVAACGGPEPGEGRDDAVLADYEGDWTGALDIFGQELPLVLHVTPEAEEVVTLDSPGQGAFGIAASEVSVEEGALMVAWDSLNARYAGRLSVDGESIAGEFSQNGLDLDLVFTRSVQGAVDSAADGPARPQEPQPPFPYEVRAVNFTSADGTELSGTLTLPEGEGDVPGVVLLTGSGPQDRDETIFGHKPFLLLSDYLTRQGIAVLRYDDRGIGGSGGDFTEATVSDFAADAEAALAKLRSNPRVGSRAGFLGHSEGGITAGLAAKAASPDFIVALASPFVPMDEILVEQTRAINEQAGVSPDAVETSVASQREILDAALEGETREEACAALDDLRTGMPDALSAEVRTLCSPAFFTVLRIDPVNLYEDYPGEVLALFGGKDIQVSAEINAEAAREVLGEDDIVRVFDDANHLFQSAETGAVSEYGTIEETMREDVLEVIADFILR